MSETKWIDWHPRIGDVRPDVYRVRDAGCTEWRKGVASGSPVFDWTIDFYEFQVPVDELKEETE